MYIVETQHETPIILEPDVIRREQSQEKQEKTKEKRKPSGVGDAINLMYHVSRIFQEQLAKGYPLERRVDRKLRRQIDEKKQAQGIRQ